MKMFIRIAAVASLGVVSFLASSFLVARGTNAPAEAKEGARVLTPAEAAAAPRGVPMPGRLTVGDLSVLLHSQDLAISGVGLLDNSGAPRRLTWSVRILVPGEPGEDLRDCEVLYEQSYDHQAFGLTRDASARPTFADVLTLPAPLPPGRYGVLLALVDAAGDVKAGACRWVEVE